MVKKCEYCGTINMFNKTDYCKNCDHRLTDITPSDSTEKAEKQGPKVQTIIDCSVDKETTIERLMAMTEITRTTDKSGKTLTFFCLKNGRFIVSAGGSEQDVYVSGEIFEENGKTKVLIEENNNKGSKFSRYLYYAVILIACLIYLATRIFIAQYKINMLDLIFTLFTVYFIINQILNTKNAKNTTREDLLIMKGEVIRRIRAIEKWDD